MPSSDSDPMQPATSNCSRRSRSGAWHATKGAAEQSSLTGMPWRVASSSASGERLGDEGAVRGQVRGDPARPRRRRDLDQVRAGERFAAADRDVKDVGAGQCVQAREPFPERQVAPARQRRALLVAVGAGEVAAPGEREMRLDRCFERLARRLAPERRRRDPELAGELLVDVCEDGRVVERHDGAEPLMPPAWRRRAGAQDVRVPLLPKRWARTAAANDSTAPDATRLHRKTTTVVPTLEEFGLKPSFSLRTLPRSGRAEASAEARPAVPTPGSSARSFPRSMPIPSPTARSSDMEPPAFQTELQSSELRVEEGKEREGVDDAGRHGQRRQRSKGGRETDVPPWRPQTERSTQAGGKADGHQLARHPGEEDEERGGRRLDR